MHHFLLSHLGVVYSLKFSKEFYLLMGFFLPVYLVNIFKVSHPRLDATIVLINLSWVLTHLASTSLGQRNNPSQKILSPLTSFSLHRVDERRLNIFSHLQELSCLLHGFTYLGSLYYNSCYLNLWKNTSATFPL